MSRTASLPARYINRPTNHFSALQRGLVPRWLSKFEFSE